MLVDGVTDALAPARPARELLLLLLAPADKLCVGGVSDAIAAMTARPERNLCLLWKL